MLSYVRHNFITNKYMGKSDDGQEKDDFQSMNIV